MPNHYQVLIIGGGTAGVMVASQLIKQKKRMSVAIIEPADMHCYQPAWTLVGASAYEYEDTARPMASFIPKQATWIKDRATGFNPAANTVSTATSGSITYDWLSGAPRPGLRQKLRARPKTEADVYLQQL